MGNANAEKGARWEREVRDYLRVWFDKRSVTRPRQEGFQDVGDIHLSPFIVQAKDVAVSSIGAWLDAARGQALFAGETYGVVAWKVRRKSKGLSLVSMTLADFREVAWRLRQAEARLAKADPDGWTAYLDELDERRKP